MAHNAMTMAVRAVTFDVYSALFDTETGLAAAVADLLRHHAVSADPRALARTWRQKQFEFLLLANSLEREPARNHKAIETAAKFALRRVAPELDRSDLEALVAAWERLPPWPEAVEVLQAVRARPLVLATLSNGDEDMLRALLRTLPVPFDHIISTEGGRFKPHPTVYRKTLRVLDVPSTDLLHVAGSATDAMGATAAGIRTLWVNRMGEPVLDARYRPALESPDLGGVLPALTSSGEDPAHPAGRPPAR